MHGFFRPLSGKPRRDGTALYAAIVARARAPHWYVAGAVPDTRRRPVRHDRRGAGDRDAAARGRSRGRAAPQRSLAEAFVDDMDPQLREIGIGDLLVGKHIGRMMGMLGGRLGAYRDGLAAGDLKPRADPQPVSRRGAR